MLIIIAAALGTVFGMSGAPWWLIEACGRLRVAACRRVGLWGRK